MKRFKTTVSVTLLTLTLSSTSLAGTIVGARSTRTGTIVGARSGNIAGTRSGSIADPGLTRPDGTDTKTNINSLISENIDGILRLLLTGTFF